MQERLAAEKIPLAAKTKTKLVLQVGENVGIGYFLKYSLYLSETPSKEQSLCLQTSACFSDAVSAKTKNMDHLLNTGQYLKYWLTHLLLFHTEFFMLSLWANQLINMTSIITD